MTKEELKELLLSIIPGLEFPEVNSAFLNVYVPADKLSEFALFLRDKDSLKFDFLYSLTALDFPAHMEVIYHLRSTSLNHEVVMRVKTANREKPEVPTVSSIWSTAEFHEREVYDLFGIVFTGHPDLRRIFLEDDWVGFPLRKDYRDDINIVEL